MNRQINHRKRWTTLWRLGGKVLLLAATPVAFGADVPAPAKNAVVQLLFAIKSTDPAGARRCYADAGQDVAGAMDAFVAERMALRELIASLEKHFPSQSADLQKSELAPFIDQRIDKEIDGWRTGTEKVLRDGSVLVKNGAGSSAVVRKTSDGWRIDFTSTTHGRAARGDAKADRALVAQEREQTSLCDQIAANVRRGDYKSLLDATRAYDARLDAIQFADRPGPSDISTRPTGPANPVVAWSLAGPCVAVCARDGSVKAWNFQTGATVARFTERLVPPRAEGAIACGPGAAEVGLLDPNDTKSLRVLDAAGKPVAKFKDFQGTEKLPNGLIQKLVGFTPDGSALITAQNSDDFIGWFDLHARRVTTVLELSKQLADAQFSVVVALRDASRFVHFHGGEAIGQDFKGHVRWRELLPHVMAPMGDRPFWRMRPKTGTLVFHQPHLEGAPMVSDATAFWVDKDKQPTRLDLRTGAMTPMAFAGSMSEVVAVDADHGYIVTRDPDDDSYWLWDAQGRKCMIGNLAGDQRLAFSSNGARLLAQVNPAACATDHPGELRLVDPIQVFRIGDGKCEKVAALD